MTTNVGPLDVTEKRPIYFDFSPELKAGETLTAVDSPIEVLVTAGSDPSPGNMLVGAPVISGNFVQQFVQGQLNNVSYHFRAHGSTDQSARPVVIANLRVVTL